MCSQITTFGNDWKTLSFAKSHTFDGYVFATPNERCRYASLSLRHLQQKWLKKNEADGDALRMFSKKPLHRGRLWRAISISKLNQLDRTVKRHRVMFGTTAAMKMRSPWSIPWPQTARLRTSRRYPHR